MSRIIVCTATRQHVYYIVAIMASVQRYKSSGQRAATAAHRDAHKEPGDNNKKCYETCV